MSVARGLLYGAGAYACWSLLSPGNAILLQEWTPWWVQTFRAGIAMILLAAVVRPSDWSVVAGYLGRRDILLALVVGNGISFALFILAQTRVEATFATLGFYTAPLWTAVLAWAMLGERVGRVFAGAVLVLLLGGWMALGAPGLGAGVDALGMAMAVGSGATWALYSVLLRKHDTLQLRPLLWTSMFVSFAFFLLGALWLEPLPNLAEISARSWWWTALQVLVPTLLALALFQAAVRQAPSAKVNVLVGLELAGAALWAWLLLGDRFSSVQLLGLALVLAAVSAYMLVQSLARPTQPS